MAAIDNTKSNKINRTMFALMNQVNTYEMILRNEISVTQEIKKTLQSSIRELCNAICCQLDET